MKERTDWVPGIALDTPKSPLFLRHKDILRLDVPVNDTSLVAIAQAFGGVEGQPKRSLLVERVLLHIFGQSGEQFHPYIYVPADVFGALAEHVVLVGHQVRVAYELLHDFDLVANVGHLLLVELVGVRARHALQLDLVDLHVALGDAEDFECGFLGDFQLLGGCLGGWGG